MPKCWGSLSVPPSQPTILFVWAHGIADWTSADTALFVLRAVSGLDVVTGKGPHHTEEGGDGATARGVEATPVSSPRPSSAPAAASVRYLPLQTAHLDYCSRGTPASSWFLAFLSSSAHVAVHAHICDGLKHRRLRDPRPGSAWGKLEPHNLLLMRAQQQRAIAVRTLQDAVKTPDAKARSEALVGMSPVDTLEKGWITGFMRGLQPQRSPSSPSLHKGDSRTP